MHADHYMIKTPEPLRDHLHRVVAISFLEVREEWGDTSCRLLKLVWNLSRDWKPSISGMKFEVWSCSVFLTLLMQKREKLEKFRPEQDSNPNLCDAGAVLHQLNQS